MAWKAAAVNALWSHVAPAVLPTDTWKAELHDCFRRTARKVYSGDAKYPYVITFSLPPRLAAILKEGTEGGGEAEESHAATTDKDVKNIAVLPQLTYYRYDRAAPNEASWVDVSHCKEPWLRGNPGLCAAYVTTGGRNTAEGLQGRGDVLFRTLQDVVWREVMALTGQVAGDGEVPTWERRLREDVEVHTWRPFALPLQAPKDAPLLQDVVSKAWQAHHMNNLSAGSKLMLATLMRAELEARFAGKKLRPQLPALVPRFRDDNTALRRVRFLLFPHYVPPDPYGSGGLRLQDDEYRTRILGITVLFRTSSFAERRAKVPLYSLPLEEERNPSRVSYCLTPPERTKYLLPDDENSSLKDYDPDLPKDAVAGTGAATLLRPEEACPDDGSAVVIVTLGNPGASLMWEQDADLKSVPGMAVQHGARLVDRSAFLLAKEPVYKYAKNPPQWCRAKPPPDNGMM